MMASMIARLASLSASIAAFAYGFLHLIAAVIYSVQQKEFWSAPTQEEKAQLAKVSHEFWSLDRPNPTLVHNFLTVSETGTQLHYHSQGRTSDTGDLVIFLHGFPDTAYLFSRYITYPVVNNTTSVALDLPGCGGSDDLSSYGADQMLNCMAAAIVQLKTRHLGERRKCLLVGHDWGGVIAFRLATETKGLVDRVVVLNSMFPVAAAANFTECLAKGIRHIRSWRFGEARESLKPAWSQVRKSGYTFMLNLPMPIARSMPRVARCLLKLVHSLEYKQTRQYDKELTLYLQASKLSAAYGPGPKESRSFSGTGETYGPSVYARSRTDPPGDWDQRIRIYGEGLLRGKWKPTFPGSGDQKLDRAPRVKFQCPVDIIFGLKDVALDPRIVLDGIEMYFQDEGKNSRIVRLPDCGHWWIHDKQSPGHEALADVLFDALKGKAC